MNLKQIKHIAHWLVLCFTILIVLFICIISESAWAMEYPEQQQQAHNTAEQARATGASEDDPTIIEAQKLWWEAESVREKYAVMLAKTIKIEAGGIQSTVEKACIAWTALNRSDAQQVPLDKILTKPNQFAYDPKTSVRADLLALSYDVLDRWAAERLGATDVGRVLPKDYLWYSGNTKHNFFRNDYYGHVYWNYSLPNPYD